jgi:hypothetical protein
MVLAAAAASASAADRVIQADRMVGGLRLGSGSSGDAKVLFGSPRRSGRDGPTCTQTWPKLGLTITFLLFGASDPCLAGGAVTVTVTSRSGWRTALGLRVGDSALRLRRLYPRARRHENEGPLAGYWLITRRLCAATGGNIHPGLLARIRAGRVSALVVATGVCE